MSAAASLHHVDEMIELARQLWGEPNRARSTRDDIRFGSQGSKSVRRSTAQWFDHEAGQGGGYASLFELVHGHKPVNGHANGNDKSSIVATYDYLDENYRLLFQVLRKAPKDFRQRRPDGKGGWIWKLDDVPPVLYRWPAILNADPAQVVYIVEGEKDSDNLSALGVLATCNPGGAGKWRSEYSQALRGHSCVVIPDDDDIGSAHADDVVRSLRFVARDVIRLDLPNLPPKGDVSDWIAAGGTAEKLAELVRQTRLGKTEQSEQEQPEERLYTATTHYRSRCSGSTKSSPSWRSATSSRAFWSKAPARSCTARATLARRFG